MSKMVNIVSKNGEPLMPSKRPGHVHRLLKSGKAKVVLREPFTVKLLYDTPGVVQELTLGIDTGSKTVGTCSLMGVTGETIDFSDQPRGLKTPKLLSCTRVSARGTFLCVSEGVSW